ncbi:MAG: CTP synthase [Candidatus Micrarchaeota archaeon]
MLKSKFIFVTGGVLSSLGKGILASSIAKILKHKDGHNASLMKIDPYLNCDAGTLNPFEHGEVFVTQDGHECDLDLGNYERFTDVFAIKDQNLMMGQIYRSLVEKERTGEYLGKTVQLIPHATNEIKKRIRQCAEKTKCEILVVEIGGTVGDIESEIVLEAARQMKYEDSENVLFVHLALVPTIITGEEKTKPMQHSVRALQARGITPDLLIGRTTNHLEENSKKKIAMQCSVNESDIYFSPNVQTIYRLPLTLEAQGIDKALCNKFKLTTSNGEKFQEWKTLVEKLENCRDEINIGVVGKYATIRDAYTSVFEALTHAGVHNNVKVNGHLIDATSVEQDKINLGKFNGFVIPGGFGGRAIEGKIKAIQFARENNKPLLGICYGFQLTVVEIARNVLGWIDANTTEINEKTTHPVIDLLPEQKMVVNKGATMRLGVKKILVKKPSIAYDIYKTEVLNKRFRHRWEMNPIYVNEMQDAGVIFSATDETGNINKVLELKNHPFLFGVQYHPEFDSRLEKPEESFAKLIEASKKC